MNLFLFILSTLFYNMMKYFYIANGLVYLYVFLKCLQLSVALTSDFLFFFSSITEFQTLTFIPKTDKMHVRCLMHVLFTVAIPHVA